MYTHHSNFIHKNYYWLIGILLIAGCDGFFGKKTDLDFIEVPGKHKAMTRQTTLHRLPSYWSQHPDHPNRR